MILKISVEDSDDDDDHEDDNEHHVKWFINIYMKHYTFLTNEDRDLKNENTQK